MTYYYFTKVKTDWGHDDEWIVVFEQGCMGKPVCLLDKEAVERLVKEWNVKLELKSQSQEKKQ